MKPSQFRPTLLGSVAAIGLMASAGSAFADDVSDLRQQINIMQEKIAKLEADKSLTKRRVAAAAAVEAGDKPRSWKLPGTNTSISIGGYVKADLLWDLGARGSLTTGAGFNNGNNAGSNATNGGAWQFHARQSRFFIRTWTPTDWGELATHFEGDFFGLDINSADIAPEFRLRHAYGRLGPVLAGQTWTTWMPIFAGAETLDFGGAASAIFVRQTQVRYTHNFGGGLFMDFAIENPVRRGLPPPFAGEAQGSGGGQTFISTTGAGIGAIGANRIPDFVLTAYYNMPKGRIWIGGIFRQLEFDTGTGAGADSAFGWGVSVAGAFVITKKIRMGFQGVIGRGVYSYFNGSAPDAVINTAANGGQGDVDPVLVWGGYVWGQYRWTDTIRSTVMWSYLKVDINDSLPSGVNAAAFTTQRVESIQQAFVNLIWSPVPQVNIGIEYSWTQQNNFGGPNFTGNRIHIAFQYSF